MSAALVRDLLGFLVLLGSSGGLQSHPEMAASPLPGVLCQGLSTAPSEDLGLSLAGQESLQSGMLCEEPRMLTGCLWRDTQEGPLGPGARTSTCIQDSSRCVTPDRCKTENVG